jgi:hypothetical protein
VPPAPQHRLGKDPTYPIPVWCWSMGRLRPCRAWAGSILRASFVTTGVNEASANPHTPVSIGAPCSDVSNGMWVRFVVRPPPRVLPPTRHPTVITSTLILRTANERGNMPKKTKVRCAQCHEQVLKTYLKRHATDRHGMVFPVPDTTTLSSHPNSWPPGPVCAGDPCAQFFFPPTILFTEPPPARPPATCWPATTSRTSHPISFRPTDPQAPNPQIPPSTNRPRP